MHTATPSFLSITRRAALRWRKARTYLGIPGYACETTGSARRQPDHIHMDRLTQLQTENISVLVRREPVPHWYATQSQKTDALPLSHGGSASLIFINNIVLQSLYFLNPNQFQMLHNTVYVIPHLTPLQNRVFLDIAHYKVTFMHHH